MRCEEVQQQLENDVIAALAESADSEMGSHLRTCDSCRNEAEQLRSVWVSLGAVQAPEPGPELRERFNLMLETYQHGLEQGSANPWWQGVNAWLGGWWPRQPALQFGVALILLAAGAMAGRYFVSAQPPATVQQSPEIVELRNEVLQMRQMVALSLMQQTSATDRLRGVNWSYQLPQAGQEVLAALLDTLMHDTNVNVRLATVDALRQFGDKPVVRRGVVDAIAKEASPMVQVALIALAVDLKEKGSVATLRELADNNKVDVSVRERARKGLAELE